jgi:glycogen debranching enzyme
MSELYKLLGNKEKQKSYSEKHEQVKKSINELFWTGEHYLDWIENEKHQNYFSTDGNLLAVLWDIADTTRAKHIEEASHIFDINEIPSACVHPLYPKSMVAPELRMIGLADYHNGVSWLWLGCINALAKFKIGMKKEAFSLVEKMATIIIEGNGVYEIYENNGEPVNRKIYKAEFPFAWSAGLFVYAVKIICSDRFK